MNSISPNYLGRSSFDAVALNDNRPTRISSSEISLQVEKGLEIEIATADGDTVTINSHYSLETAYLTYSSQGLLNGSRVQTDVEAFHFSEQLEFDMTIEGDLNKEELKDIRKTLHLLEKILKNVGRGREGKALEQAERISKLESISQFEAVLSYRRVEQATIERSLPLRAGEYRPVEASLSSAIDTPFIQADELKPPNDPIPPRAPAISEESTVPEESTVIENRPEVAVSATLDSPEKARSMQTNFLAKKMVEIIFESRVEVGKIGRQVNRFLDHLIGKFEQKDPGDFHILKLAKTLKSQISPLLEAHEVPEKSGTLGIDRQEPPQLQTA